MSIDTTKTVTGVSYNGVDMPMSQGTLQSKSITITRNGTTTITPDSGVYGLSSVEITTNVQPVTTSPIYGVEWTNDATTTMTRTDDATSMTYSVTGGKFASDFDNVFPYNQMKRETISGNVFVKIPSMWFRIGYDANKKIVSIAVSETQGDAKTGEGVTYEWRQTKAFYYGAYGASSNGTTLSSVSGATRVVSITRAVARTRAMAVGTGYHQRDLYAGTILMFLFWIEYATKKSQNYPTTLGGVFPTMGLSAKVSTGGTDSIYNETEGANFCVSGYTSNNQIVWHGIEDFFNNTYEWEDGITGNGTAGGVQYVSDDYTKYNDTGTGMNTLSYNSPASGSGDCLEALGWDTNNPFLVQPIAVRNDSNYTTGFTDYASTSNNIVSRRGAYWGASASYGLSAFGRYTVSDSSTSIGCRLVYEP